MRMVVPMKVVMPVRMLVVRVLLAMGTARHRWSHSPSIRCAR
jgi:hypothetical protein